MSDMDLIKEAQEQAQLDIDAELENREEAEDDLRFQKGEQWTEEAKSARKGRPCLTINKVAAFHDMLDGDFRMNRPSPKVIPFDSESDPEVAKVMTGIVRYIFNLTPSKIAIDRCFSSASACGYGNMRVITKYFDEMSFDQDIALDPVPNPFSVLYDRNAKTYDKNDGDHVFIFEDMPIKEFERKWPDANPMEFDTLESSMKFWRPEEDTVRVAEYFVKDKKQKKIYLLRDKQIVDDKGLDALVGGIVRAEAEVGVAADEGSVRESLIVADRMTEIVKIYWYLMSGSDVLEPKKLWPGKYWPTVPMFGKMINIMGVDYWRGCIRNAKDSQKAYNYWRSATTESVADVPKAPYLMTPRQLAGHEGIWARSIKEHLPYLLYNPDEKAPGAPQRTQPATVPTGAAQEIGLSDQEMREAINMTPAKMGQPSNERSARAINARARGTDIANYVYADNMARTMEQVTRVIIDLIPRIYNTERVVRILHEDNTGNFVKLNGPMVMTDKEGRAIEKLFDVTTGRYDVTVGVGPSYQTLRQEASDGMMFLLQTSPEMMNVIGDLVAENQDWPGAQKIAERIRKMIAQTNPQLLEQREGEEDQQGPSPEQVEAMINQAVSSAIEEYKKSIEGMKIQKEMEVAQRKVEVEESRFRQEQEEYKQKQLETLMKETQLKIEQVRLQNAQVPQKKSE